MILVAAAFMTVAGTELANAQSIGQNIKSLGNKIADKTGDAADKVADKTSVIGGKVADKTRDIVGDVKEKTPELCDSVVSKSKKIGKRSLQAADSAAAKSKRWLDKKTKE